MGKVMERRYICKNGVVEKTRFAVGENAAERPRWRKAKTAVEKREENQRQAVRELARILNCNADGSGFLVTLNYSEADHERLFAGMDEDAILRESSRQAGLYIRRLKRKAGTGIKYAYVASDRERLEDGTLVPCRVHNHIVVMGATQEQLRDCWELGVCTDIRHLYEHQEDYTPLAAYLVLQVRSLENYKKYNASRNMDKPEIQDRVVKGDAGEEIRVQPGAKVLDRMTYREGSVVQYVRYKRKPKAQKRGGHKMAERIATDPAEPRNDKGDDRQKGGGGFEFSKASWV